MNRNRWLIVMAVLAPIAVLFGPALLTDCSFAMRDAAHFYYPLFEWTCREWGAGRIPLWNPYESGGIPVVADASSSIFYPGKLLFLLPLSFALRYKLYIVGHVVLAAAGTYRLARYWQASGYAAAIAAVAFALGGNVVYQYCNIVFLVGAAWLPWALQAVDRMLVERHWPSALVLGGILALMILGGDPQAALHTLLLGGFYLLFLQWREPRAVGETRTAAEAARPPSLVTSLLRGPFVLRGVLLGLAAVVGFLLASVQILPSSQAAKGSERAAFNSPRNIYEAFEFRLRNQANLPKDAAPQSIAQGFFGPPDLSGHHGRVYDFSIAPWRVAEFVWPNISGQLMPTKRRWAGEFLSEGRIWNPSLYLGVIPLLLALSQLRLWRGEARTRWLSWVLLIFLVASFGEFGLGWVVNWIAREIANLRGQAMPEPLLGNPVGGIYWLMVVLLPTYVYFRYPAKLLVVASLAISLLAARGWDQAFREPAPRLVRVLKILGIASLIAAGIAWVAAGMVNIDGLRTDAALGPFDVAGAKWDILTALLQTGVVCLLMKHLLQRGQAEPTGNWQALGVLLTVAEITLANAWMIQTSPGKLWREPPAVTGAVFANRLESSPATDIPPRVYRGRFSGWRPPSFAAKASPDRMTEMNRWERDTLFPKYPLPVGISLVESYGSLKSLDYQVFLDMAKAVGAKQSDGATLPHSAALRLLGTEQLLVPEAYQPGFAERIEPPAGEAEKWPENASLWRMKRTLPRAWIVPEALVLPPLREAKNMAVAEARTFEVLFSNKHARDFRSLAVVETDEPLHWVAMAKDPAGQAAAAADADETSAAEVAFEPCAITHYDPQRVRIEATLARPGLLVFSDVHEPGWIAQVETTDASGSVMRELPILRTNRVMRGVELPAGQHVVEFRYRPTRFYLGAAISALSALVVGLVLAFAVRKSTLPISPQNNI